MASGAADGVELELAEVSRAYVAGEETALLAALEGRPPKPRLRPPFPAERGLSGRPTLVQNVETLAAVALVNAYGSDWFRGAGTETDPGTGLFSVGRFGGGFMLYERPYGYPLRELLVEAGVAGGVGAVLVGGYSGGLLPPERLEVALAPADLAAAGARLGTKSIQVLREGKCPLRTAIAVLRFFGGRDGRAVPARVTAGSQRWRTSSSRSRTGIGERAKRVDEVEELHGTLAGRGLCALPDGAATVALSYLRNFGEDLDLHMRSGCPSAP